ncbi:nucleotide disphospho-sugar-binding domain-containing protein [Streptomyces cyaneofuscatus]|uniref:nucleotide disphospho-sugar-binding domain-containing protein n=1 Tax=Streptomyces cyaneofuscatus TaxID=66883 RepID=UPI003664C4A2
MKVLFIAAGSPATVFGIVPLANAVRGAGHEVFMAGNEAMVPYIASAGLPALAAAEHEIAHYMDLARAGTGPLDLDNHRQVMEYVGSWFALLGADSFARLRRSLRGWRPDLVVGGTMSYAAPLLAAALDVPYVVQEWTLDDWSGTDAGALRVLEPHLAGLGLTGLPEPELRIGICPPAIAHPDAPDVVPMRWRPGNRQGRVEPWMYERPGRPRVCLTAGSRAGHERGFAFLRALHDRIAPLGVEVVIPAPDPVAAELRAAMPGVLTGWIPLDTLMPTCDLVVHHSGGATTMTAADAGVPQLIIPETPVFAPPAQRLADHGAGIMIAEAEATDEAVERACREILADARFKQRADEIAVQIAQMPAPPALVPELEKAALG